MPGSRTSRGILTADLRIDLRAPPWTGRGRTGRLAFFQVIAWLLLASRLMQFVFYQLGATGHLGGAGFHVAWTLLAFMPGLGSLVLFCLLIQPTGRRFP